MIFVRRRIFSRIASIVVVVPVLVVFRRRTKAQIVDCVLLVINYSRFLKHISQIHHTVAIISVKTISPELPQFALRHFTGFLHLLRA